MLGDRWRFPTQWTSGQRSTGSSLWDLLVTSSTGIVSTPTSTVSRFVPRPFLLHPHLSASYHWLVIDWLLVQMQQRRNLQKLPLQANFYPMSSASFLQDSMSRLSLLSAQSQAVAALRPGERRHHLFYWGLIIKVSGDENWSIIKTTGKNLTLVIKETETKCFYHVELSHKVMISN